MENLFIFKRLKDLAQYLEISERQARRLKAEGMPQRPDGYWDGLVCQAWRKQKSKDRTPSLPEESDSIGQSQKDFFAAEKLKGQIRRQELEYSIRQGELIERAQHIKIIDELKKHNLEIIKKCVDGVDRLLSVLPPILVNKSSPIAVFSALKPEIFALRNLWYLQLPLTQGFDEPLSVVWEKNLHRLAAFSWPDDLSEVEKTAIQESIKQKTFGALGQLSPESQAKIIKAIKEKTGDAHEKTD